MERRKYKIQPAEVWDKVRQDYLAGLGAEEAAAKYDVTVHSLRARATKQGWSRYLHTPTPPVDPPPPPPVLFDATDVSDHPAGLAQATLKASARALAAGLWSEARTLATLTLAETYRKMGERADPGRGRITPENAPLQLLYDLITMDSRILTDRFAIDPDNPDADPVKTAYWAYKRMHDKHMNGSEYARIIQHSLAHNRIEKLEAQLVAAGLTPIEDDPRKGRLLRGEDVILGPDGERIPRREWERRLDEDLAELGFE